MTLPKGWMETTIGEIAETKLGKMLDGAKNKGEPTPYLRNISVRWGSFDLHDLPTMLVTPDELVALAVRDGDLFVCEGGVPGRCAVWRGGDQRILFQKAIHRIRPLGGISADYLQRFLVWSAGNDAFDQLLTGTTIKHLPQVGLQRITLPIPPLAEQRRIVAKLDTLTARLTRARTELERVPAMTGDIRKRSVDFAFAELPRCRLGDVAESIRYGYTDSAKSEGPGSKFLRITDIQNRKVDWSKVPFVEVGPANLARCALQTGDIVFARSGATVGKSFLIDEPPENAVFASYLIRVRLDAAQLLPAAAAYFFQSADYWAQIAAGATGTGQPNFNGSKLAELSVPFGDVELQKKAIERVDNAFARADRLEAEAARAHALLDRLEAALLARAFRGELVPQDPTDEPASALLDRIRSERVAPTAKRGRRSKVAA